jgi:predicted short-subunit dehydrogenase-like oxidoreductase (DUF2520 family)
MHYVKVVSWQSTESSRWLKKVEDINNRLNASIEFNFFACNSQLPTFIKMSFEPSISFIGAGNLAWHLAPALDNAGFSVKEVFSQNPKHAEELTDRLYQAEIKATLDFSTSDSSVFVVAVSDSAIKQIAQEIILPDQAVLIHTSGSVPMSDLSFAAAAATGVFYPLQSFTKTRKADFKGLPIFVESSDDEAEELLFEIGRALGGNIHKMDSEARAFLHLSAVFASNFTNHMITVANQIVEQQQLRPDWLKPLIKETIEKSLSLGPMLAQTGPARRGDLETLDKHLEQLKDDKKLMELYQLISQHIIDTYQPD